jgi:hypothetical protein
MSDFRGWVPDEAVEKLTVRRALQKTEDPVQMARDIMRENVGLAALAMAHLAVYSNTEMIRFNAAKYIMEKTFDPKGSVPDAAPAWAKVFDATMVEIERSLE